MLIVLAGLALSGGPVMAQGTVPTTTVVTIVNPQGSGNTTSTAISLYGQPVAVTFAVTAGSGATAPDGSVSVYVDGMSSCSATLGSPVGLTAIGTCNLTVPLGITTNPGGGDSPHVISASYTGTATFGASASSGASNGSLAVHQASTTTTITAHTPDPSVVNSPIAVTAIVQVTPPGQANINTYRLTISDGSANCFTPYVHFGEAGSCNLIPTTAGTKTLTAHFVGDLGVYGASDSPGATHTVTGGGTSFTGPTVAPGVSGTATLSGGGPTCAFVNPAFVPVAPLVPPAGTSFPFGLFSFATEGCIVDATINIQIVYTQPLPAGTQYWKFGPTPGGGTNATPHWYVMPGSVVSGNTVTFTIRDGEVGDDDLTANGTIVDQGGPAVPAAMASPIPTLTPAMLAVLTLTLIGLAWMSMLKRSR